MADLEIEEFTEETNPGTTDKVLIQTAAGTTKFITLSTLQDEMLAAGSTTWTSWTPSWTDLTIGNGTEVAEYKQIGKTVFVRGHIIAGTTTSAGLSMHTTLPVAWNADYNSYEYPLGLAILYDDSAGTKIYSGRVISNPAAGDEFSIMYENIADATYGRNANTDMDATAVPFQLTTNDRIVYQLFYEAS